MPELRAALIKGLVIAVLGVGVSCARTDAASAKVEQVMAVGCRIGVRAEGEPIRIEAVATSRADVNGSYRLDIRKNSADGSSHNIQSGKLSLEANKEKIFSTTFLGASDARP